MATRVTGANAKVAIKPQASFGVAATGNYVLVPFNTLTLAPNDQLGNDAILGLGRQAQRPSREITEIQGRIEVPVDAEAIGWWLYALFGAATVTGAGPYTHVWKSDLSVLPRFTIEVQHSDGASAIYTQYLDVMANGFSTDFAATGRPKLSIDLIASTESESGSSGAGTPTTPTLTWFHQRVNSLKKDTVALGKVPSFQLTYANNIEVDRYVGGGGLVGAMEPGQCTVSGNLRARFNDSVLRGLAVAATVFDLEAGWTNTASQKLLFEIDQAELARRGREISGPGGIEQAFELVGSLDQGEGSMLRATLTNATASYA